MHQIEVFLIRFFNSEYFLPDQLDLILAQLHRVDLQEEFSDPVDLFSLVSFFVDFLSPKIASARYEQALNSRFFDAIFSRDFGPTTIPFRFSMIKKICLNNVIYDPQICRPLQHLILNVLDSFLRHDDLSQNEFRKCFDFFKIDSNFDHLSGYFLFHFLKHLDLGSRKIVKRFLEKVGRKDFGIDSRFSDNLFFVIRRFEIYDYHLEKQLMKKAIENYLDLNYSLTELIFVPRILGAFSGEDSERQFVGELKRNFEEIIFLSMTQQLEQICISLTKSKFKENDYASSSLPYKFYTLVHLIKQILLTFAFFPGVQVNKKLFPILIKCLNLKHDIFGISDIDHLEDFLLLDRLLQGNLLLSFPEVQGHFLRVKHRVDRMANDKTIGDFVDQTMSRNKHKKLHMKSIPLLECLNRKEQLGFFLSDIDSEISENLIFFKNPFLPKSEVKEFPLAFGLQQSQFYKTIQSESEFFSKCKWALEKLEVDFSWKYADFPFVHDFKLEFNGKTILLNLKSEDKMMLGGDGHLTTNESLKNFFWDIESREDGTFILWIDQKFNQLDRIDFKAFLFDRLTKLGSKETSGVEAFLTTRAIIINQLKKTNNQHIVEN